MATTITSVFGNEICVTPTPQIIHRQYTGYPGANGLTSMHLGTRGRRIFISGRLRASGNNYNEARSALRILVNNIEELQLPAVDPVTYTYRGETYYDCVLDIFELLKDQSGKDFRWNSEGKCFCDFLAVLISQRGT